MKNFLFAMFSNRFGIVLATANLIYFLIKMPILTGFPRPIWARLFIAVNAPALCLSRITDEIVMHFVSPMSFAAQFQLTMISVPVFIVLQWLFIAWAANKLAVKVEPKTP